MLFCRQREQPSNDAKNQADDTQTEFCVEWPDQPFWQPPDEAIVIVFGQDGTAVPQQRDKDKLHFYPVCVIDKKCIHVLEQHHCIGQVTEFFFVQDADLFEFFFVQYASNYIGYAESTSKNITD